jgi:hypothetical protein
VVSLIKRAMGVLVIAALLSATLLGVGCGGGDDGSERAVKWTVDRVVSPKSARLTAVVEVCLKPVGLERPIIEYSGDRAYVELRHTPDESEGEQDGCSLLLAVLHKTAIFERDLDELVLFDASTDPPEQRWPRRR